MNTKDAVKNRAQAGKVMYNGQTGGDELWEDDSALAESRAYRFSGDGLIVERDLDDADWRNILPEIKAVKSAYQLIIGDWMVYGFEHGYEVSYEAMAVMTGLNPQTIEVYTSICRNVPQLIRINPLTFSHYRLIAPLSEDERIPWIEFAVHRGLSFRALQKLINLSQAPMLPASTETTSATVTIPVIDSDRPALPDEMEEEEATEIDSPLKDKGYKKRIDNFWLLVTEDRIQEYPPDDWQMVRRWFLDMDSKYTRLLAQAQRQQKRGRK